jgi:hypothetical protein
VPGAPNRPPEIDAPPVPAPTGPDPARQALRRLVPSRVALRLPIWKGAPAPDVLQPYLKAAEAYRERNFAGAESHLDQLAIRLAEPRWPSLPGAFRDLRVKIPVPRPPHRQPDHGLAPEAKEAAQRRRDAETQLGLAEASVERSAAEGLPVDDLREPLASARAALAAGAPAFWEHLDRVWAALHERVPEPAPRAGAPPAAPAVAEAGSAEEA